MHDLNAMYLYAKVVEHGSYTAAARTLGVQTSMLSRQVSDLERRLGVRLLNRTTRRMSVTDVGHTYYLHCAALVAEAEAAAEAIDRTMATPRGTVRLSCPAPLLDSDVAAIVARYLAAHPQVRIQIEATGRRVDPVEEGIDIALRVRLPPLEDSGLAVRPLAHTSATLVASPALLARITAPQQPDDLATLPTVDMAATADRHLWHFVCPDGGTRPVSPSPRLSVDDFTTLRKAAIDGIGIALLPHYLVRSGLADGTLVALMPAYTTPQALIHAVFASRRGLVPAVRTLLDALVAGFGATAPIRPAEPIDAVHLEPDR